MAIHSFVPTGLRQAPCGTNPWYTITTEEPVHLRLLVWFQEPAGNWLYVSHRGKKQKRKFIISQPADLCIDQNEDGASITHTWVFPLMSPGIPIWVAWSETCVLRIKQPSSPPRRLVYPSCTGTTGYVTAGSPSSGFFTQALDGVVGITPLIEGDAAMYVAVPGYFVSNVSGTYNVAFYCSLAAGILPPWEGDLQIRNLGSGAVLSSQHVVLPAEGQPIKVNAAAQLVNASAGQFIALYWVPTNVRLASGQVLDSYAHFQRLP